MTRPDASYRELARQIVIRDLTDALGFVDDAAEMAPYAQTARVPMTARDHMSRARAELVAALRAMGVEPDANKTA
ncbi:MAG TPA: hypothetical protein VF158_02220 [Longimicrobiales bacterium]